MGISPAATLAAKQLGYSKVILSDRDPKFLSEVCETVWKLSGTKLLYTTAYHPQDERPMVRQSSLGNIYKYVTIYINLLAIQTVYGQL